MQCPGCNHEAAQAEFGDPLRCPVCGAFYAKALAARQKREAELAERTREAADQARVIKTGQAKQVQGRVAPTARVESQPVTVVDIQMPFWSMVTFMVKWSIAAIPALMILAIIISVPFTLLGVLVR